MENEDDNGVPFWLMRLTGLCKRIILDLIKDLPPQILEVLIVGSKDVAAVGVGMIVMSPAHAKAFVEFLMKLSAAVGKKSVEEVFKIWTQTLARHSTMSIREQLITNAKAGFTGIAIMETILWAATFFIAGKRYVRGTLTYDDFKKEMIVATGSAVGSVAGVTVGSAIGSVVIPIPFLGTVVGSAVGGWIGEAVGSIVGSKIAGSPSTSVSQTS